MQYNAHEKPRKFMNLTIWYNTCVKCAEKWRECNFLVLLSFHSIIIIAKQWTTDQIREQWYSYLPSDTKSAPNFNFKHGIQRVLWLAIFASLIASGNGFFCAGLSASSWNQNSKNLLFKVKVWCLINKSDGLLKACPCYLLWSAVHCLTVYLLPGDGNNADMPLISKLRRYCMEYLQQPRAVENLSFIHFVAFSGSMLCIFREHVKALLKRRKRW